MAIALKMCPINYEKKIDIDMLEHSDFLDRFLGFVERYDELLNVQPCYGINRVKNKVVLSLLVP